MTLRYLFLVIASYCFTNLYCQDDSSTVNHVVVDMNTVYEIDAKSFELFYKPHWFENDSLVKSKIYQPKHQIPKYTDEELIEFFSQLPTTLPLSFNNVIKKNIEQFAENRRLLIAQSLGIGAHYFPIIEEELIKKDMPIYLKYLPVIESNLNPFAKSHSGAVGFWQFMPKTGKYYGLEQNDYYDERKDPIASTQAAIQYLSELHRIYDDWFLALAAYNAGPGNVNKAIGMSGGKKDFWEIRAFLPRETQDYVPRFIACAFVMELHSYYDILPMNPDINFFETDTFIIHDKLSFQYISEITGIDSTYLVFLNPALKKGIVPKTPNGYPLNIPMDYITQFAALKDFMTDDPYLAEIKIEVVEELSKPKYNVYKVKSGDTLGHIAMKYGVGVSQIKKWNSLKSDNLKIGQKLVLYN